MFSTRRATDVLQLCAQSRAAVGTSGRTYASVAPNVRLTSRIPLVNFGKFRAGKSRQEKQATADAVLDGLKNSGFVYLSNHGIPEDQIHRVHEKSAGFFRLPTEVKSNLAWDHPRSNRGYVPFGQTRLPYFADPTTAGAADHKETLALGRDWDAAARNKWPRERDAPGFKQALLNFFQTCHRLHVSVMRAVALGLRLEERFFDDKIDEEFHNLRLLSYPAVHRARLATEGQARAGAYTDHGTITLLFQDSVGGFEVQNPHTQQFQAVPPIDGTIVVNAGDLLARWTNDTLRSTLHRVVAPPLQPTGSALPARQSITFLCHPNDGAEIACLPTCASPGGLRKYHPVTAEEYVNRRLAETYLY